MGPPPHASATFWKVCSLVDYRVKVWTPVGPPDVLVSYAWLKHGIDYTDAHLHGTERKSSVLRRNQENINSPMVSLVSDHVSAVRPWASC